MRIAILSDIHGNRTASEAVLANLRETSPDLVLHRGDLADGGSSPAEIVNVIRGPGTPPFRWPMPWPWDRIPGMGMFQVSVTLANPQSPEQAFQAPFWVDTGALYSFAPEDRLRAIGIVPKFPRDFVFADGKVDRRLVGEAAFSIEGTDETITCLVVFGPPGSLLLLGATALENFGVQADPTTQKLRPITAVIGTAWSSRAGLQSRRCTK